MVADRRKAPPVGIPAMGCITHDVAQEEGSTSLLPLIQEVVAVVEDGAISGVSRNICLLRKMSSSKCL